MYLLITIVWRSQVQTWYSHFVTMYRVHPPKSANEEDGRSISCNQQIGAKRSATIDISQKLIGSFPNTSKSQIGKLQRGASRTMRWLLIWTMRRFGVCIMMVRPWLQGTRLLHVIKIVVEFCHYPNMIHNLNMKCVFIFHFRVCGLDYSHGRH